LHEHPISLVRRSLVRLPQAPKMAKVFASAALAACACVSLAAATVIEGGNAIARVFQPQTQANVKFLRAANIPAPDCPSHSMTFEDLKSLPDNPQTFVVPHTKIVADGVRCGKTGANPEYLWLIPSVFLLDTKSADAGGVRAVYDLMQKNARMNDAFKNLISVDPLFVGVEMGDRYCGETLMWAQNSLYIYVQAENKIINFAAFGWIANNENAMLAYHAPVGQERSKLCIYKDSAIPGPSTTPIPSPPAVTVPLVSPSPGAFSLFKSLSANVPVSSPDAAVSVSPDATPSISPSPSKTKNATSSCFPAAAKVELESGAFKRMDELAIGDRVRVGPTSFSTVFMFTHKLGGAQLREFVNIDTASGHSIKATTGHYIVVNGGLKAAGQVKAGDVLTLASGESSAVTETSRVLLSGLYNPQTEDGMIVVDGVVSSAYTTAVHPTLAHAVLAPLRILHRMGVLPRTEIFHASNYGLAAMAPPGSSTC
jgi:Hint module